jgi:hypothetical protein
MASSSYEEDCKVVGKMKKGKTEMGEKWYYASLPLLPFDTLVKDANNRFYSLIPHNVGSAAQPRIDNKESIEVFI